MTNTSRRDVLILNTDEGVKTVRMHRYNQQIKDLFFRHLAPEQKVWGYLSFFGEPLLIYLEPSIILTSI